MKIESILFVPFVLFSGCANVASSRFSYQSIDGSKIILEIPKEIEAKNLEVQFDSQQGKAKISAQTWISRNQGTIKQEADRETRVLESGSVLAEKISEGTARGVVKGVIPTP